MKTSKRSLVIVGLTFFMSVSCAPSGSSSSAPSFSLPAGWYVPPENGGPGSVAAPSSNLASGAQSVLQANLSAAGSATAASASWGLGAINASFGVSSDGIFGILSDSGSMSVTATWQNKPSTSTALSMPQKAAALVVTSSTTAADVNAQLEPAIEAAIASGAITNETQFRSNVQAQGQNFLGICQSLNTMPATGAWGLTGFQLMASFSASGEVATVGVGTAVSLTFMWRGTPNASGTPSTPTAKSMAQLIQSLAADIPYAVQQSSSLTSSGFTLSQVSVGVGISTDGTVGVATVGGSVSATLMFGPAHGAPTVSSNSYINLIDLAPSQRQAYASRAGIASTNTTLTTGESAIIYQVPADAFKSGLSDAIKMSVYFAGWAKDMNSGGWALSRLSTTFSASVTGPLTLSTVDVRGNLGLMFSAN